MSAIKLAIVVAAARNGVIGRAGDMPWRLPSDLRHFKALTLGKPVVMGRRTWTSIGRALPGRPNIVVTRDPHFVAEGADIAGSLDDALQLARDEASALGVSEVCIIGGGEIYRAVLPLVDTVHLTVVEADIEGDTVFPAINPGVFEKISDMEVPRSEKDSHSLRFTTWQRRAAVDAD